MDVKARLAGGQYFMRDPEVMPGSDAPGLMAGPRPENAILKMRKPDFPQFLFEWHPKVEKVYVIREIPGCAIQQGELVAFHIKDHASAENAVLIWLRGYRTRDQERQRNPALKAEDY